MNPLVAEKARKIKLLLMDVDGVLTNGGIIIDSRGVESKVFDVKDGHGLKLLMRAGVEVGIISGRESPVVALRAKELGISILHQKVLKKVEVLEKILAERGLKDDEVAYIGDDVVDLPILIRVGLAVAVADAMPEVKERADYITSRPGGRGAVRELAELLLKAQDKWAPLTESYRG